MSDEFENLRKLAEYTRNLDDTGGVWCFTNWAEKSNDSGVLAAIPYATTSGDPEPATGLIENDPDAYYSNVIAACEDDIFGGTRAAYIAAACPATVLRLLDLHHDLVEALSLHQAWADSESAGPDYGRQTRDTHPDGERIWRDWWEGNLSLCARAQKATIAVLAKARGDDE